jgi:hypothetical protein
VNSGIGFEAPLGEAKGFPGKTRHSVGEFLQAALEPLLEAQDMQERLLFPK